MANGRAAITNAPATGTVFELMTILALAALLNFQPIAILPQAPAVASDGSDFVVFWRKPNDANNSYFEPLPSSVTVLNDQGEVIRVNSIPAPAQLRFQDLIWSGEKYIAGWYYYAAEAGTLRVHLRVASIDARSGGWSQLFDTALADADLNSRVFKIAANGLSIGVIFQRSGGEQVFAVSLLLRPIESVTPDDLIRRKRDIALDGGVPERRRSASH